MLRHKIEKVRTEKREDDIEGGLSSAECEIKEAGDDTADRADIVLLLHAKNGNRCQKQVGSGTEKVNFTEKADLRYSENIESYSIYRTSVGYCFYLCHSCRAYHSLTPLLNIYKLNIEIIYHFRLYTKAS